MKILALDIGLKRIGIAICFDKKIVTPLNAIIRQNRNQAARDVGKILKEYNIDTLIVGIPKGGSCEEEMQKRIHHFVSLLNFDKEIIFTDESFSSKEAMGLGIANLKKKDGKLDSLSAYLILKNYYGIV
ncbi:Holliday junction resolvase RuvX [Campylobacter insulaenigrae]|uniref:Putative pre-16S rRNA nuclease n=1 Tax=Campylobacter insulaenigrae TaxID=260714 RepID=A0ABY3G344_9BACT|nr:Holliday junction resolvase RuvX [Campylobacter insulaenigrae]TWO24537.1 Holliday junction resolvase RuvX [Campylobacter insulaenigrae]